jgi:hypothetical protein
MNNNTAIHNKKVADIIHTIGLNHNLRDEEVKEIVEAPFKFMQKVIKGMSLDTMNSEEIDELKTNFFFKYLGKIYTSGEVVRKHKYKLNQLREEKDEKEFDGI